MSDPLLPNSPDEPQPLTASRGAESLAPLPPSPNLDSDITDELTDHLSLAARDLQLAGHALDEAQKIAHQKFGDVATIRRRLWWIHQGDELMLRTALAIVSAVLVLAVAALGLGNWRMSRTIDNLQGTLADLGENQKKITDAQNSILEAQQLNRPLTIQGRLYVGDPSKPAPAAEVHLYRVSDRKLIDKYQSDSDGHFVTAPLAPDRYFVVAPLVGFNPFRASSTPERTQPLSRSSQPDLRTYFAQLASANERARPLFGAQSQSLELSLANNSPKVELNVEPIPVGQLSFEPPKLAITLRLPTLEPRTTLRDATEISDWARYGYELGNELRDRGIDIPTRIFTVLHVAMIKNGPDLPVLSTHTPRNQPSEFWSLKRGVYGGGYRKNIAWAGHIPRESGYFSQFGPSFELCEVGEYQFAAYQMLYATGRQSDDSEAAIERLKSLPANFIKSIQVREEKRTDLKLADPPSFEKDVLAAIETVSNQEQFNGLFDRVWPVQVEPLGYEDMILAPESTSRFMSPDSRGDTSESEASPRQ